ncbi:MAG TPA: hypothetical protein VGG11_02955 [Xanthobacteraceae bacterium]|jgi:hypothetical protein
MSDNVVFLDQFRRGLRTPATLTFAEFQNDCFQACVVMQALDTRVLNLAEAAHLLMELPPRARRIVFLQLENR